MQSNDEWTKEINENLNGLFKKFRKREEELKKKQEDLDAQRVEFDEDMKRRRNELMDDVKKEYDKIKCEWSKIEEEKRIMSRVNEVQNSRVKLDVGGNLFTTSVQTLTKENDSMLAIMFSGRHELSTDENGSVFIDRDGTHFRYILNYLRDGLEDDILPTDEKILREILREANYYQLTGLSRGITDILTPVPQQTLDFTQVDVSAMLSTVRQEGHFIAGFPPCMNPGKFVHQNMTKLNMDFRDKNLSGLSFAHTTFAHNVLFVGAKLVGTSFYGCEFLSAVLVDFQNADLTDADFRQCRCSGDHGAPSTSGANLLGSSCSSFIQLILNGQVKFEGAHLIRTKFDPDVSRVLTGLKLQY